MDDARKALTDVETDRFLSIIKSRDATRWVTDYDSLDRVIEILKAELNVHVDDRLRPWWVSSNKRGIGGGVPQSVRGIKGEGHWDGDRKNKKNLWRRIPTTPQQDSLVQDPFKV